MTSFITGKDTKKKIKGDVCSASNPASICAAANTCGSASSPCSIDIKRSQGTYATATPSIPEAKSNKAFCIKVGTTVTFMSSSKNTGFVIDSGSTDPFDHEGAIIGAADRAITVAAKHPGCYTYSVGACTPGTVYGMCGNSDTQLIISANQFSTHSPTISFTRNANAASVSVSRFLSCATRKRTCGFVVFIYATDPELARAIDPVSVYESDPGSCS